MSMKVIFILFPLIYIGGNIYLYWRALQALSAIPLWLKVIFSILFWSAAFSMFISIGFRNASFPETLTRCMYNIGAVWMVFLLYMVLALLVCDLIHLAIPSFQRGFWYSLALVTMILIYGNINYHRPDVKNMQIAIEKEFGKGSMRIVALSDVHLGHGTGVKALRKYVDLINSQSPDLILITGDLIDNSIAPLRAHPFDKELERLSAPVYMVPGNHEYISSIEECEEYLAKTPVTMLRDSVVTLPQGLQIVGRDDRSNSGRMSLEALLAKTDESKPVIVLDHQPYELALTDSLGADIQISGHTHAGQIWPLSILIDLMYEQAHGYRKWDHAHIYVSSGLSLWGPPFRIGTRSELGVIDLVSR